MNTRRTPTKRNDEKLMIDRVPLGADQVEKVRQGAQDPPQCYQVTIGGESNEVSVVPQVMDKAEIIESLLNLAQPMKTKVIRDIGPWINSMERVVTQYSWTL